MMTQGEKPHWRSASRLHTTSRFAQTRPWTPTLLNIIYLLPILCCHDLRLKVITDHGGSSLFTIQLDSYIFLAQKYFFKKNHVCTLQLSQKSDFQSSTTKPDNICHPTVKTGQIWPLEWFWRWISILWELKIFNFALKKFISNLF